MTYFDTSGLVKLVLAEDDSALAVELWNETPAKASSELAYPEGRAGLASARRAGRVSRADHRLALEAFERFYGALFLVGVTSTLTRRAGDLADELALRGYDAVHLASAISLGAETTLVTWDGDLARAASGAGCAVAGAV